MKITQKPIIQFKFPSVKECVKGTVTLLCFDKDEAWYECENGFRFPIAHSEWDGAIFLPTDKGLLFMRWIRKHLAFVEESYKVQQELI